MSSGSGDPAHQITRGQLREAIRSVFYPRIPLGDVIGQERVDRAAGRVLDAIEAGR